MGLHLTTWSDADVGVAVIVAAVAFVALVAVAAAVEARRQRARFAAWCAARPARTWAEIRASDFADVIDDDDADALARAWDVVADAIGLPAHRLRADDRFDALAPLLTTGFALWSPFEDLEDELADVEGAIDTVGDAVRAIAARWRRAAAAAAEMPPQTSSFTTP